MWSTEKWKGTTKPEGEVRAEKGHFTLDNFWIDKFSLKIKLNFLRLNLKAYKWLHATINNKNEKELQDEKHRRVFHLNCVVSLGPYKRIWIIFAWN